jgi:uncharacterized cupin superfamily protein
VKRTSRRLSISISVACLGYGLCAASAEPPAATDVAGTANASAPTAPMPMNPAMRSSEGFKALPPWPSSMVKWGDRHHAWRTLYVGEVTVGLYEASDGLVTLADQPYDEVVHVVRGECILTPDGGKPQRYKAGDVFIVPKGYSGSWEGRRHFREFIVIETNAYNRAVAAFFGPDAH